MATLHLTLKRHWFDLVASGEKVVEYREYKRHWVTRLLCKSGTRNYNEVRFTNGYGKKMPFIRIEFIGMAIFNGGSCNPDNGEPLDPTQKYFVIGLGEILEVGNND